MVLDGAAPAFRLVAIGAAMFAFGRLAFSTLGRIGAAPPRVAAFISLAASVGGALSWATVVMGETFSLEKLARIFGATFIGKAWIVHILVASMLAAGAVGLPGRRRLLCLPAALSLASFSPIGHAAAAEGAERIVRIFLQSVHLLGAGFWIGALPLLIQQLAVRSDAAGYAVRTFAAYATAAVAALVAAALANLYFLTGGEPFSLGADYARTLLIKVTLVAAAIGLAAINRIWLTPRRRYRAISRLAAVEIALLLAAVVAGANLAMSAPWR